MSEHRADEGNGNIKIPRWVFMMVMGVLISIISWLLLNLYGGIESQISNVQAQQQLYGNALDKIQSELSSIGNNVATVDQSVADLKAYFKVPN